MVPAAMELGIDVSRISMAVAWGDAWTNNIRHYFKALISTMILEPYLFAIKKRKIYFFEEFKINNQ